MVIESGGMQVDKTNKYLEMLKEEQKQNEAFRKVLKEMESMQETEAQRRKRKAEEAKAEQDKKDRQKKIDSLRARIAQLRSKLMAKGGRDPSIEAQVASLETELFWLMMGGMAG